MTALSLVWDKPAGLYLTASKSTNRPSEVPTAVHAGAISSGIHNVCWRRGTSEVSPTLWIGSAETSPQYLIGWLHAPTLTLELHACSNFPPKRWSEHLFFFVFLRVVCLNCNLLCTTDEGCCMGLGGLKSPPPPPPPPPVLRFIILLYIVFWEENIQILAIVWEWAYLLLNTESNWQFEWKWASMQDYDLCYSPQRYWYLTVQKMPPLSYFIYAQ